MKIRQVTLKVLLPSLSWPGTGLLVVKEEDLRVSQDLQGCFLKVWLGPIRRRVITHPLGYASRKSCPADSMAVAPSMLQRCRASPGSAEVC